MKFKSGDKVRCIDSSDLAFSLTVGSIYEVKAVEQLSEAYVTLAEIPGSWKENRFVLAEPETEDFIDIQVDSKKKVVIIEGVEYSEDFLKMVRNNSYNGAKPAIVSIKKEMGMIEIGGGYQIAGKSNIRIEIAL